MVGNMDRVKSSGILPNGLLPDVVSSVTRTLDVERWSRAEERIAELISCIQPNSPSEERRNAVANYVERLIMNCISCQVFKFGSVPLKTYLPDGDIDLTACSGNESLKDSWASAVRDMLEKEEKSETAEFRVKEVQYIQAEVKLIKCLVENIVVDISFNQVGGLCTLCFLEEMDKLINQNHLFKRSIILIKAWCYYESRILGAHHGLISTYALETLVLYIFHVFNNSFAGPLEVLYRFLEFFSNFDWDNFCLSLWGPVPISSLPDMTAEPPRKDGGKLLLTKGYLDDRSQRYAVTPGGQESHSQPFISKHFNVVDPLRTNNNLGRSVSKGNFYRIRSAFAFGARRLSRLLECPKEAIIAEVNQFFMNTWERHGSRNRPDVPNLSLWHCHPSKTIPVEEVNNLQSNTVLKKNDYTGLHSSNESAVSSPVLQNSTSEAYTNINQNSHIIHKPSNPSTVSRVQNQKIYNKQTGPRIPDQVERNNSSLGSVQSDKSQKNSKPNYSFNDFDSNGQGRFQFARTRSSPELTETSFDLSRGRRARATESSQLQSPAARLEYGRRKNSGSEVAGSHSSKSSLDDPTSMQQIPSQKNIEVNSDSQSSSNNYHNDIGFQIMGEDLASLSEALEMQQEEQDMVNMMDSNMHRFHGAVQYPPFSHIPLKFSPLPASMGFSQRNLAGVFPSNLSVFGHSWGHPMQFPPGLNSSPVSHYYPVMNLSPNQSDLVDSAHDSSTMIEVSTEDADHATWYEHEAGTSRGLNSINSGTQMLHLDDKTNKSYAEGNFNSSRGFSSSASSRSFNRIREDNGLAREDHGDSFHNQASENDNNSSFRANQRSFPVSQAGARSKLAPENSREGHNAKYTKPGRGTRWGRKPASSSTFDPSDRGNSGLQRESSSDHVPSEVEDEVTGGITPSLGTEMSERISESGSSAFEHSRTLQTSSFDPLAQRNASDPLIPFPMLMSAPRPRGTDNSKVLPVAFIPTGPPVPFYIYPVPFRSNTGNPDGSEKQFDQEELNHRGGGASDQSIDSMEVVDNSDAHPSSNSSLSAIAESAGGNSDILNSDYASHLENLKYVRSCQNMQYNGQLIYSSPVVMPPVYLQSHQPWDSSGRPVAPNINFAPMVGYGSGLVPLVSYPQPSSDRASAGFQRFGDEAPRYRGGTGTYLPIPKNNSFRDRQSGSRNHRGNYYDRNNHGDREGSWISSKQRANHNHGRNQNERPSSRADRLAAVENQTERVRESHRHGPVSSYVVQNSSLGSANSSHGSANMVGVYPQAALNSNGIEPSGHAMPPVMVVYPYDHSVGYASPAESLELGSLGRAHLINGNEASQINDAVPISGLYKPRRSTYRGGSPRSTDRSSSP